MMNVEILNKWNEGLISDGEFLSQVALEILQREQAIADREICNNGPIVPEGNWHWNCKCKSCDKKRRAHMNLPALPGV